RFIGQGGLLLSGGMPARTWRQHAAMTSAAATAAAPGSGRARTGLSRVEIDNARRVPAPVDKAQEIGRRDRRRTVVFERVIIERIVREHALIEHHPDAMIAVIDEREWRDAAGPDAEHLVQQIGVAEGEARRRERVRQPLQVDAALLERDNEPQPGFFVFQEEALAMTAR